MTAVAGCDDGTVSRPSAVTRMLAAALALTLTACTADDPSPTDPTPTFATSSPATTTPYRPDPPQRPFADICAEATLARLDLAGRAGQVLMVGLEVTDPLASVDELTPFRIGNVFLAGRSSASADSLRTAISGLQALAVGTTGTFLQVAVDQEGGFVQTLTGPGFSIVPTALEQVDQPDLAQRTAQWAAEVAGTGITLNLAPVADVVPAGTAPQNPPVGASSRQYGSEPADVAAAMTTVVTAMREAGLGTTVKHFPGLGRVRVNTDTSTGATDAQTTADDPALLPFQAGIDAGTDAVMVSSASYPQLDRDELATFSAPIIGGLLRDRLGFDGLVISDDLGNAVAVSGRPAGQRAVDFLAAGGDLVLTVNVADAGPMTAAVVQQAQNDPAFASRLDEAALRVLRGKQEAGLLVC